MMLEGLRGYLQLASGLADVSRERARGVARSLVAPGDAAVSGVVPEQVRVQVAELTEDLLATSRVQRDLLLNLVRSEVERSVSRLGLVSTTELEAAARRERVLEERVHDLEARLQSASAAQGSTAKKSTAKKSTAKKSTAKKSTAKKSTAKKSTAKKSTASRSARG